MSAPFLSAEEILATDDLTTEAVEVPEWATSVRVRTMTALERDALGAAITGPDGKVDGRSYRLQLVARTMVKEDGSPLFSLGQVESLGKKSTLAIDRVFAVADRLNVLSEATVEAAAKN